MKNISHHLSSLTTGAAKGLKNLKLLASLATVLTFSSCDKPSVDPINPGTEVPTEKSRLAIARDEFNAQNTSLVLDTRLSSFDNQKSDFNSGYLGKIQSDQIFLDRINDLAVQGNLPKGTFTLFEFGNPELFKIINSNYPRLLETGVIQFKLFGPNGQYDETNEANPKKNIFADSRLKYVTSALKHSQEVFETIFGKGIGELNLSHFNILAEKFPTYGTSPIKIYIHCSIEDSGLPYISSKTSDQVFVTQSLGNDFNVQTSSYTLNDGTPTWLLRQINANNSLLFFSLPNQNDLPARNKYVTAGVEYDQKYGNIFMIGATQSTLYPITETQYSPISAPTLLGYSGTNTSLGLNYGTSFATPRAGIHAFKALIVSGGSLKSENIKVFLKNSTIISRDNEPVIDYGTGVLRAMGLIPSQIETGSNDGYLVSDKFEVIDPTGKITIDYKDGKSYIKIADAQKYNGSTLNLVAKITYGGKVYFPAIPVKIGTSASGSNKLTYAVN